MQQALRPYATAGIALVGASMIAVTPLVLPPSSVQVRSVRLVDAWSDLFTDTAANLENISSHADLTAISGVFSALLTNPLGVIEAFTNLTPSVSTDLPSISVTLPPGLEVLIAQLGADGATLDAIHGVIGQLISDPSNALSILYEGAATILNAYLNGADNVSILDGIINIPLFNGILAPLQSMDVNLNLTDLINALGLGNLSLSNLDLSSLLSQLGLGDLTLGNLFSDLGLSTDTLGTLLGNPTLGDVLSDLGLGGLGLGSFNLTSVLSDLGLDTNVDLSSLSLSTVLGAFGLNSDISLLGDSLGSLLNSAGLLSGIVTDLNGTLDSLLSVIPGLSTLLTDAGLNVSSLLTTGDVEGALSTTLGDLLGVKGGDTVSDLLAALGISIPSNLSVGTVLTDLGFSSSTASLTLSQLLGDLGGASNTILDANVGSLLDGVTLGQLLGDLGLSDKLLTGLPGILDLGDLSNLNLDGLLGDLGLGDIANISVDNFGGLATLLADVIPQQILASI
jgi:hypothetical protein